MSMIITAILAYLLGSIPFGLLVSKQFGLGDIRQIGSGNIGATNVLRSGNKTAALLTLILDMGKGVIAVLIARAIFGEAAAGIAGLCALLGHLFPIFLKFKGGKGVATFIGALLALSFPTGIAACAIWLLTAALGKMSSLSSLATATLAPIIAYSFYHLHGAILIALMSVFIFIKHLPNIKRILDKTEPKIGQ